VQFHSNATSPERNPFHFEAEPLLATFFAGKGDPTARAHHAVPRYPGFALESANGESRTARESSGRGHLAVGDYFSSRNAGDDLPQERKSRHPRARPRGPWPVPKDQRTCGIQAISRVQTVDISTGAWLGGSKSMKMPRPSPKAARLLADLCESDPRFEMKKMFGQPAAFVRGRICFGTFGPDFFVRLASNDCERALALPGARPFEPMAGRPMKGYIVLPPAILRDPAKTRKWIDSAAKFTLTLPPKTSKKDR